MLGWVQILIRISSWSIVCINLYHMYQSYSKSVLFCARWQIRLHFIKSTHRNKCDLQNICPRCKQTYNGQWKTVITQKLYLPITDQHFQTIWEQSSEKAEMFYSSYIHRYGRCIYAEIVVDKCYKQRLTVQLTRSTGQDSKFTRISHRVTMVLP